MYKRIDSLNSRTYSIQLNIAQKALIALKKINDVEHAHDSILFNALELRMIIYDNAFAALENFLEHIGYILFDNWDSQKNQRGYGEKQKRLLSLECFIDKASLLDRDFLKMEFEWKEITSSINLLNFSHKRNPIKHAHSGKHDTNVQKKEPCIQTMMNSEDFNSLVQGTIFELTDNDCEKLINEAKDFMLLVHTFLNKYKLHIKVYDGELNQRKDLFLTFLDFPFAPTMFCSEATIML